MKSFLKIVAVVGATAILLFMYAYKRESDAIDLADRGLPTDTPLQKTIRRCAYARHYATGRTVAELPGDVRDLLKSCAALGY